MSDLLHQNFGCVQSDKQPTPKTVASAAVLTPTTKLTFVTGVVAVATITPPVTGYHTLSLCFTNVAPAAFPVTGNIAVAYTPIQNRVITLHYDPSTAKYYPETVT